MVFLDEVTFGESYLISLYIPSTSGHPEFYYQILTLKLVFSHKLTKLTHE